jgi:hypothetical protein
MELLVAGILTTEREIFRKIILRKPLQELTDI